MKQNPDALCTWLKENFGFSGLRRIHADLSPGLPNILLTANDSKGRALFIKSGTTAGLYRNEYRWSKQFHQLAPEYAAQPLYCRDEEGFRFFACAYLEGKTLDKYMSEGPPLSPREKKSLLEDLYGIFLAFQASDMVHRDIRPQNLLVCHGRMKVVDFQLAVPYARYEEPDFLRQERGLLASLGEDFAYGCLLWDDAWSLLQVAKYIGKEKEYAARYDEITAAMAAAAGLRVIRYGQRERRWWKRFFWESKLLSLFALTPSRRREYRRRKIAARYILKNL